MPLTANMGSLWRRDEATAAHAEDWKLLGLTKEQMAIVGLRLVILVEGFSCFYKLGARGIGSSYHAATVKSMLASWHNFLCAAYEPGGSVTVDQPPLGLWLQTASASLCWRSQRRWP
jgi:hypothetical protein